MNPGPGKHWARPVLGACGLLLASLLMTPALYAQQPVPGIAGPAPVGPGATPGLPGLAPGIPGLTPGVPGMMPGIPGYYRFPPGSPFGPVQQQLPATAPVGTSTPQQGQQPYGFQNPWAYPAARPAPTFQPQTTPPPVVIRPYLETEIESTRAYVHQNLVLTLRLISTTNLKTATAQMLDSDDVIFRQLGDATVDTRVRRGQTEIVNTLYFQLTPLRSGNIELQPVRVDGDMDIAGTMDTSYQAIAPEPIRLTVSEPVAGVQPWLPLHELVISASLSNDERIGEGEPITLTVVQRAVGMSGAQLPTLEAQLQAPEHRLYREKSDYEGIISKQGQLVGTRTDRYTLVPQQGNEVKIPSIRVNWWNVARQRKETAVLPSRLLNERENRSGDEGQALIGERAGAAYYWAIWAISIVVAFALGRYWLRLAPHLRRFRFWLWQQLHTASQPALRQTAEVLARMSPQRNLHRLRRQVADQLPRSARLWFCVRSADDEKDPDDWSQVLRFLINRRLGLSAQLPMSKLAQKIIEIHPGADEEKIRALLGELEAALFAGRPIADFGAWKKEFKHQIRPRPFARWRRRHFDFLYGELPSLNPGR